MSIISDGGRFRSQRTQEETIKDLSTRIEDLLDSEFAILHELLREMAGESNRVWKDEEGNEHKFRLIDLCRIVEYEREVISPEEWIEDPYYFGKVGKDLFPRLKEDFVELFTGDYNEVIMTGAIGTGKTFFSNVCIIRTLYEMSCLRNPQRSYGQAEDQTIAIGAFHSTKDLARKVIVDSIASMIRNSPYFMEHFRPKITKSEIVFPNNIWLAPLASNARGPIGLSVFAAIFDEANFKKESSKHAAVADPATARSLYNAISRRMKSRFDRAGRLPGLLMLPSSKQTEDDFTQKRILEAVDDPKIFIRDYAQWSVLPKDRFSRKRFRTFVGSSNLHSRILEEDEEIEISEDMKEDGCQIIEVPENFRFDFEANIDDALRDYAGIATITIRPFITNRSKIYGAVDNRKHPFEFIEWNTDYPLSIKSKLLVSVDERKDTSTPILNPTSPRYIHLDPSLTSDSFGFAMGHIAEHVNVVRRNRKTGQLTHEQAPIIIIDMMLRIVPPKYGEIDHGSIRELIYTLSEIGYPVRFISMDSYQSAGIKQKLRQKGYKSDIISVDRKMDPYDMLKEALYEDRIKYYKYKPFMDEIKVLIEDKKRKKVDHLPTKSKDVADAVCGVVYALSTRVSGEPLPVMKSVPYTEEEEDHSWVIGSKKKPKNGDSKPIMPFIIG